MVQNWELAAGATWPGALLLIAGAAILAAAIGLLARQIRGSWADGLKVLIEEGSQRILGAYLVGPQADEVINRFAFAIRHGITANDLKTTVFAYPTAASDMSYMCEHGPDRARCLLATPRRSPFASIIRMSQPGALRRT